MHNKLNLPKKSMTLKKLHIQGDAQLYEDVKQVNSFGGLEAIASRNKKLLGAPGLSTRSNVCY